MEKNKTSAEVICVVHLNIQIAGCKFEWILYTSLADVNFGPL